MSKRSEAQIRAEKAYETRRAKTPVGIRLDAADLQLLDKVRGKKSRSAFLLDALKARLK
jgi:hypothetical protein